MEGVDIMEKNTNEDILIKINFGKKVRYYRKKLDKTQDEMADAVAIDVTHLRDIENGRVE